jgi:hypothetical protein
MSATFEKFACWDFQTGVNCFSKAVCPIMNIFSSSPKNRPPKVNDQVSAKVDIWSARHNQVVGTGGMYVGMIRKGSRGIVTSVSHLIEIEIRENLASAFPMSLKVQTKWPLPGAGGAWFMTKSPVATLSG